MRNVDDSIYATDVADYLVERGVPFRNAHRIVGKLVLTGIDNGKRIRDFSISELKKISEYFDHEYYRVFDPVRSVERHDVYGGTSLKRVNEQIKLANNLLVKGRLPNR